MHLNNYKNRLYGRTKGRSNKKIDIENYSELIQKFSVSKLDKNKSYILDIGSGYGETSVFFASLYKKDTIIACDKYINGNFNLVNQIQKKNITNIRLHSGNVIDILENNKKKKFFSLVSIFFPDPWPKKKHYKRRLISKSFLEILHPFIKNKGRICIVTDSISYSRSIINCIYSTKLYYWSNQKTQYIDVKNYYNVETKYYKKAIISGRKPILFILTKI